MCQNKHIEQKTPQSKGMTHTYPQSRSLKYE